MRSHVLYSALAVLLSVWGGAPAFATDLDSPRSRHKRHKHHYSLSQRAPGPVLAVEVVRPPTCNAAWPFHYPNYKQASCRDYSGFATVYDPRSPDGVAIYGFRALHGLQ